MSSDRRYWINTVSREHVVAGVAGGFTHLGTVTGDDVYQVRMREDFHPWRLAVRFDDPVRAADARPLVERLSFIPDPRRWGYPFRRGLFEVAADDFAVIEAAMRAGPPG
jgi:hypothetical protein